MQVIQIGGGKHVGLGHRASPASRFATLGSPMKERNPHLDPLPGGADIPVCGFPELSSSAALFSDLRHDNIWGLESPQNPQTRMSALRAALDTYARSEAQTLHAPTLQRSSRCWTPLRCLLPIATVISAFLLSAVSARAQAN